MGEVYRAKDTRLDHEVAIKGSRSSLSFAGDPEVRLGAPELIADLEEQDIRVTDFDGKSRLLCVERMASVRRKRFDRPAELPNPVQKRTVCANHTGHQCCS